MLNCIHSHGALRGPQVCSTLPGCGVPAAVRINRCHARLPIVRLPPNKRVRVVSKAARGNGRPTHETPQSIIDLIAEEAPSLPGELRRDGAQQQGNMTS